MRHLLAAALAVLLGLPAAAHEDLGPNGGQLLDIGAQHAELVVEGGTMRLFLVDGSNQPIAATGASAQATVLAGGKPSTVTLQHVRDNLLEASEGFTAEPGMIAVVKLTMPNQAPAQTRFKPPVK